MKGFLRLVDRIAGWLLLIGALLHGYGSYRAYPSLSSNLVWALSGSVAALHSGRHQSLAGQSPGRSAAGLDLFGRLPAMGWRRVAFAATLPNPVDPRPLYHLIVTMVLVVFSLRTALGS